MMHQMMGIGERCGCDSCNRRRAQELGWTSPDELQKIKAQIWDEGYTSGHSRAMRKMSDEPNVAHGANPYRKRS